MFEQLFWRSRESLSTLMSLEMRTDLSSVEVRAASIADSSEGERGGFRLGLEFGVEWEVCRDVGLWEVRGCDDVCAGF